MASSTKAHRAVAAGISGGVGIVLPLAAAAATMPFADAHELVRADALPVAAGALAGVGLFAFADYLLDRREERLSAEAEEAASFASVFGGTEAASPRETAPSMAEEATPHMGRAARSRRTAPKGVPVISRAVDALDEADAWAEIDAMLNDDSPISCDPARSKDMYEIALEELRRAERAQTASAASTATTAYTAGASSSAWGSAAAGHVPAGYPSASPESTDVFMALANGAVSTASIPQQQVAPQAAPVADFDLDEVEEASARDAAIASLYGSTADMAKPTAPQTAVAPLTIKRAPAPASVPVADYSGHEDTWAAALAILEEDAPVSSAPAAPAHFRSQPVSASAAPAASVPSPAQTAYVAPDRMALVAEGGNATRAHAHVNAILEEEFDKVPSSSVRRTSREFLRVIQGGTASMPRLQAQA